MNNAEILKTAMAQSAIDLCAEACDFEKNENVVAISYKNDNQVESEHKRCIKQAT